MKRSRAEALRGGPAGRGRARRVRRGSARWQSRAQVAATPASGRAVEDPRDLVDSAPVGRAAPRRRAPAPVTSAHRGLHGGRAAAAAAADDDQARGRRARGRRRRRASAGISTARRSTTRRAPRGAASAVGLARVRIASVDAPLDYAAAKGNAEVAAAATELAARGQGEPRVRARVRGARARAAAARRRARRASTRSRRARSSCRTSPRRTRSSGSRCWRRGTRPTRCASSRAPSELDPGSAAAPRQPRHGAHDGGPHQGGHRGVRGARAHRRRRRARALRPRHGAARARRTSIAPSPSCSAPCSSIRSAPTSTRTSATRCSNRGTSTAPSSSTARPCASIPGS